MWITYLLSRENKRVSLSKDDSQTAQILTRSPQSEQPYRATADLYVAPRPVSHQYRYSTEKEDFHVMTIVNMQIGEAVQEIRGALLETTTEIVVEDISNFRATRLSAVFTRNQIRGTFSKYPNLKTALERFTFLFERDNIFAGDSDLSVGTVIMCMSEWSDLGSNNIVDVTKLSSQKSLFTKSDWKSLKCKFSKRLDDNNLILDLNDAKLQEIEKLAKIALSEAREIAGKYEANHRGASSTLFDFYYEYLKVLEFKKYVFRKDIDITKTVMIMKVWGPLIESIMRDMGRIRLKWYMGGGGGVVFGH
ncbi:hypothetical protein G6F37_010202 [Rhizopus arrhizus]|nr:hypothetical protein G6F38_010274 [Rhizopus arrhizus]KAG1153606.1 hypothetical protein G6F37_010202 [Rhizopus arrhizus]